MISVLIVHARREPALALAMSRLVEGALDGLLSDVAILDLAGDDLAAALAEDGGCALLRPQADARTALDEALAGMRGGWALIGLSGLAPAAGWSVHAREALALAQAGARIGGAALQTPPRGLLRRRRSIALVRREALAAGGISLADPAGDALGAAARLGAVRRIDNAASEESGA